MLISVIDVTIKHFLLKTLVSPLISHEHRNVI